jgi:hypothetical protein
MVRHSQLEYAAHPELPSHPRVSSKAPKRNRDNKKRNGKTLIRFNMIRIIIFVKKRH